MVYLHKQMKQNILVMVIDRRSTLPNPINNAHAFYKVGILQQCPRQHNNLFVY